MCIRDSVQPLWRAAAEGRRAPRPSGQGADLGADLGPDLGSGPRVALGAADAALVGAAAVTLNGLAQGIIADRVADLLLRRGFAPRLIDAGEMVLPGPSRRPLRLPEAGVTLHLADCAAATSAPGALRFADGGGHLIDPRTGASPDFWRSVTVIAPDAATADALSTAFAVSEPDRIGDLVPQGAAVIATEAGGRVRRFGRFPAGAAS